jgi:hypothetical protein
MTSDPRAQSIVDYSYWFTLEDAARVGDPAMPATRRGWAKMAVRERWRSVPGKSLKVGKHWAYHFSLFPDSTQVRLLISLGFDGRNP